MIFEMDKIIFLLCALFVLTKGNVENDVDYSLMDLNAKITRIQNYIDLNRWQHKKYLNYYDKTFEHFTKHYFGCLEVINVQLDMITAGIDQTKERLDPLIVLSDSNKHCIKAYNSLIPSRYQTEMQVANCSIAASKQIDYLLHKARSTRNKFEKYYKEDFERDINECIDMCSQLMKNCSSCTTTAISRANEFTKNNKKEFEANMDEAECTAKAYFKKALDCSYNVQTHTISEISKANVLIDNCLKPEQQCLPCPEGYTCPYKYKLKRKHDMEFIKNPFYNDRNHPDCLMLTILENE